jgi:glutaredoxin
MSDQRSPDHQAELPDLPEVPGLPDRPEVPGLPDRPELVVYWRPGCGYCNRLFRVLRSAGITAQTRNIWEDPEARQFVQDHNRGNETVPTVSLAGTVMTNPDPQELVATVREHYPQLAGDEPPGRHAFAWRNRRA